MLNISIMAKYFLGIICIMKKEDLKSLVTEMYENLLERIDDEENATKEQVVDYLKDAVNVVSSINDSELDSISHAKSAFNNAYKEIAKQSLSSYKETNKKFEKLTQMHDDAIKEHIDLDSITEKFNEIQTHMSDEVQKANKIITQLTKQVKSLEETSNIDSLTKVFNRRALTSYLNNVCSKTDTPYELHFLLLDIDDFKIINDKHGHIAGDKILIFIANILRKTLRDGDKVFRYGGEEFVIILNRIDENHCRQITQRLLTLVSENKLIYKGVSLNVTMSIGTTKLKNTDSPDTLFSRADKALYKAKENGKNQMQVGI